MKIGEDEESLRVGDVAHVSGGFSVLGFGGSGSAPPPPPGVLRRRGVPREAGSYSAGGGSA